jgi:hypothetical protein
MTEHPQIDQFNDPARFRDTDLPESVGQEVTPYLPFGLRTAKITDIESRSDLIKELSKQIPENEFGLPQYYYRPDMLDKDAILGSMQRREATFVDEMLQAAIVRVSYAQGFPTLDDSTPVWAQMPWESKESYDVFTQYLVLDGVRSLAQVNFLAPELVNELFHCNYWYTRAKSYDLYRSAHHSRLREQRIMSLNDNHWTEGDKIMRRLTKVIGELKDEELVAIGADKLIASLERVTRIQRSAVGLSSTGGRGDSEVNKVTSVEIAMRKVSSTETKPIENDEFDITLLSDPEVLKEAQALIVKVNR